MCVGDVFIVWVTHCNALQRTATYCNALQHTATHCNALHRTETLENDRFDLCIVLYVDSIDVYIYMLIRTYVFINIQIYLHIKYASVHIKYESKFL